MLFFTATSIARAISKKYSKTEPKELGDCWVLDQRNGNLSGPYNSSEAARSMANALNEYCRKSGMITRPFSAHSLDGQLLGEVLP